MLNLNSVRCPACNKLLFKAGEEFQGRIFIICPRCNKQTMFAKNADGYIYSSFI